MQRSYNMYVYTTIFLIGGMYETQVLFDKYIINSCGFKFHKRFLGPFFIFGII